MDVLWLRGLREDVPDEAQLTWQILVAWVLSDRFAQIPPSASTLDAELALGIERSVYWYVGRTQRQRGYVVFGATPNLAPAGDRKGVSPFDSGGLWYGKMTFQSDLSVKDKVALFARHDFVLLESGERFERHLLEGYGGDLQFYIAGNEPTVSGIDVPLTEGQSPLAWTWEARVPLEVSAVVAPRVHCWMTRTMRDQFEGWFDRPHSDPWISDAERDVIDACLDTPEFFVDCSERERPYQRAMRDVFRHWQEGRT